jgi:hypothetical protein
MNMVLHTHQNMDAWSVVIATAILLWLLYTVFQILSTMPRHPMSPFPPPIVLSVAWGLMGNGDLILCYPAGGRGTFISQIRWNTICVITRSQSEHIAMLVHDNTTNRLVVLENSVPKVRLIPIEQYVRSCHRKGLRVTWRPLQNGGISRAITNHFLESVIAQPYPTPLQSFAQVIAVLHDIPYHHIWAGHPFCTTLITNIMKSAKIIPVDIDTRRWSSDNLSSRCWPPDHLLGCERELILIENETIASNPTNIADVDGVKIRPYNSQSG